MQSNSKRKRARPLVAGIYKWEPLYKAHLDIHGHLDVAQSVPIIGPHMSHMRSKGSFRAEFFRDFPGEFWESHSKRVWACKYKPLYKAHLDIHGHLNVPQNVPIIGTNMRHMRETGGFKKEFAHQVK